MNFQKDFDELLDEILTDYRNQFPEADTSQGSLIFIRSACLASAVWGLYHYQEWISKQIFPDSADTEALEHHVWVRGLSRTYKETDSSLLARLLEYIRRPPAGGNKYDYVKWAKAIDNVAAAYCYPLAQGLGTVDVVVVATGGFPHTEILREGDDLVDAGPVGQQHDQAVHAQGDSGAFRHGRKFGQEPLRQRVRGLSHGPAGRFLLGEAAPLFFGVDQLRKTVGHFHPQQIELEALDETRIRRLAAGEGALGDGIVAEKGWFVPAEMGLDLQRHRFVETVCGQGFGQGTGSEAAKGLRHPDPLPGRRKVDFSSLIDDDFSGNQMAQQLFAVAHLGAVVGAGLVPFQQGELGKVALPPFLPPPAVADLKELVEARRQQPFHAHLRGGVEAPVP